MDNFREKGSSLINILKIIIHEDWNSDAENYDADIALLRVKKQIQYTDFVKPICLFKPNDGTGDIKTGWLIGYGESSNTYPRKLILPILGTTTCLRIESGYRAKISPRMFCAGSKSLTNICGHDMGDGLFVKFRGKYFLAGIASFVMSKRYGDCDFKNAALFTNVHLMSEWINRIIRPNQNQNQIQYQQPTATSKATYQATRRTTKKDNDAIFFPSDDDYNYDRGPVGLTTARPKTTTTKKQYLSNQQTSSPEQPTFDILAKGNSSLNYFQKVTERPVQNVPMNIEQTAFEYDCGKMKPLKSPNGGKTEWNDFPWTATIIKKGNVANLVVGTLLSYRHVFVNAEMLKKLAPNLQKVNELQAYFGLNNIMKITAPGDQYAPTSVDVQKLITNPNSPKIGVLILANAVEYGKKIFPICLWDSRNQISTLNAYSIGFENQERKSSLYNIKNINECSQKLRNINTNEFTCARSSSCLSSGSPLYVMKNNIWYLFASHQSSSCLQNQPEVFENLKSFTPWMQTTVIST